MPNSLYTFGGKTFKRDIAMMTLLMETLFGIRKFLKRMRENGFKMSALRPYKETIINNGFCVARKMWSAATDVGAKGRIFVHLVACLCALIVRPVWCTSGPKTSPWSWPMTTGGATRLASFSNTR